MQYLVLSFSHKNADVLLREKLSFCDSEVKNILVYILDSEFIQEAILLSTCNRLEIIMITNDIYNALNICFSKLGELSRVKKEELEGRANIFEGYSAAHHIFLVASSLDSVVIGETQIVGQLKKAYRFSLSNNYCSNSGLGSLIDFAFKCSSNVRNNTQISRKPISVASVAVGSISNLNCNNKIALVIGIGEMGQIVIKNLLAYEYRVILVNRTMQKALDFQSEINDANLVVEDFANLENLVNQYEIIFSATSSHDFVVKKHMIENTSFKRYFFDLSIPRDIEVFNSDKIEVILVDDLQHIVNKNMNNREQDLNKAYEIVGNEANEFFKWLNILSVKPIIKILRQIAKDASLNEINKGIKKGYLPKEYKDNIEKTIHNVFNVFLHTPTKKIKEMSSSSHIYDVERVLKLLFDISDDNLESNK